MNDFVRNLLTEWRKLSLPFDGETFVVGVSGGADSLALLFALSELKRRKKINSRFVVAHFNHGLRGEESDADALFVKNLTAEIEFEFALKTANLSKDGNLEQNARLARYEFLREIAENLNARAILTAHTANDQAETFLLNLIRGSGLEGLGGMKTVRPIKPEKDSINENNELNEKAGAAILLARPLLSWATRELTENFCRSNEIEFRFDSMNENLAYKRVRIRKILLPMLEDFNPQIIEILTQTAFLLQKDFESLKWCAETVKLKQEKSKNENSELETEEKSEEILSVKELKTLFPSIRQQILRDWIKASRGNLRSLDKKHFDAIENLIFSRKSGRTIELPGGHFVRKDSGGLIFIKNKG